MDLLMALGVLLGGFLIIALVVTAAVGVLRWVRRNRAEAAAMMTGTSLQDVVGVIGPPDRTVSDWLGDLIDSWSESSPHADGHQPAGHHDMAPHTTNPGSPEGYSEQ